MDKYLAGQFVQPFMAAFLIALFVLVMQFLWVYIDEIMGKGVGMVIILEMIAYLSVSLIPMALPIAVLLASVMLFGNLAERFELTSMKSSGMSLIRIMMPLIIFTLLIAGFSFYTSNNLMPVSNLKFHSRLYDIRKQQPTLALEPGVFNYDFQGYTVRIGERMPDGRNIKDVLIYDNSETRAGVMKMLRADSGEMFMSGDRSKLIMRLYHGTQYQDIEEDGNAFKPFLQTNFQEYQLVFDLTDFELERTDEERFSSHRRMFTVGQLSQSIDSIGKSLVKIRSSVLGPLRAPDNKKEVHLAVDTSGSFLSRDSIVNLNGSSAEKRLVDSFERKREEFSKQRNLPSSGSYRFIEQTAEDLDSVNCFIDLFSKDDQNRLYSQASGFIQTHSLQIHSAVQTIEVSSLERRKQIYEKHRKFAFAVVCIIFLFIGAPMGAIIRKGGFGYPLLVAILFFTLYVILYTVFDNMNDAGKMDSVLASWLAELILFPLGVMLSIQAMKDSKLVDLVNIWRVVLQFISWPFRYLKNG